MVAFSLGMLNSDELQIIRFSCAMHETKQLCHLLDLTTVLLNAKVPVCHNTCFVVALFPFMHCCC